MKIRVAMRTPDAIHQAINGLELDHDELTEVQLILSKWFLFGESCIIEVDTKEKTATVARIDI